VVRDSVDDGRAHPREVYRCDDCKGNDYACHLDGVIKIDSMLEGVAWENVGAVLYFGFPPRRLWAGVLLHEHVHRVDFLDFERGGEKMMLFVDGTPRFEVPATEWRAAFVQSKYYGDSDCGANAFANYYARTFLEGDTTLTKDANKAMFVVDADNCDLPFRSVGGADRTILRLATILALLESDPEVMLDAMVRDGLVSGGVAFFLYQWVQS
jgi:hypothetical protein